MKIKIAFSFACLLLIAVSAIPSFAQTAEIDFSAFPAQKVKASTITWKSHFGGRQEEPHSVYILMTQGGFRAPTSSDFESLIQTWLAKHPKAETILVFEMEGLTGNPESKFKAVWVVEGEENLNIHLVRNGGCPGGTMVLNKGDKTPLTKVEYEAFVTKLIEAEQLAKKEKLGIWKELKS